MALVVVPAIILPKVAEVVITYGVLTRIAHALFVAIEAGV